VAETITAPTAETRRDPNSIAVVASPARPLRLRSDRPWVLALYASTLVLGLGVLTLPAEGARSGVLITVGLLAVMWVLSRRAYRRIVTLLSNPLTGRGGDALGDAMDAAGAGSAGHRLALVGVAAYVVPATIGYATIGAQAIDKLAVLIRGHHMVGTVLTAAGVWAASSGARRLDGSPLAGRLARQLGTWTAGVAITSYMQGAWRLGAALAVFTVGAWQAASCRPGLNSKQGRAGELEQGHLTSIAALGLQAALMFLLAAAAVWTLATSPAGLQLPAMVGHMSLRSLLVTTGVVAFSLVGTGWVNLHCYSAMAGASFRKRAADASMVLVGLFQAAWLAVALLAVPGQHLIALDQAHATSAQGISDLVAANGMPGWLAGATALTAAAVVGIAATGAANGFSESLALEVRHVLLRRRRGGRGLPVTGTKRAIVALAALVAGVVQVCNISASSVLAIGGLAGGSVLVWIMGAIAESDEKRLRKARIEAMSVAVITGIGMVALTALTSPGGTTTRVGCTALAGVVAVYILILTNRSTKSNRIKEGSTP
jgi:hypothetical protein